MSRCKGGRTIMRQVTLAYLAMLVLTIAVPTGQADARGDWLDGPLPAWNWPGTAVPIAPPPAGTPVEDPSCADGGRPAEIMEDRIVTQAGWTVFGTYEGGWGIKLVWGLSAYDGMCRPLGYQQFVFVDGIFAGTLSPHPMDSRTDGSLATASIGAGSLRGEFNRYTEADPFCCPSSRTVVEYRIDRTEAGPVVLPVSSSSYPLPS
jgi:hypothetical protein